MVINSSQSESVRLNYRAVLILPLVFFVAVFIIVPSPTYPRSSGAQKNVVNSPLADHWIVLITEFSTGDYMEQYTKAVKSEAERLGLRIEVKSAQNSRSLMARMVTDATFRNASGILISHGDASILSSSVRFALRRTIPVVSIHCDLSFIGVAQVEQDDSQIAKLMLDQMIADTGGKGNLALIWTPGYAPMEKRIEIYNQVMDKFPDFVEIARFGKVSSNTLEHTAIELKSVLQSEVGRHLDLVWATWDEFAKGAAKALMEANRLDIQLYGIDVSNSNLKMLQDPKNPWVATAGVDPKALGIIQVRLVARGILGKKIPQRFILQPQLIKKAMLPSDEQVTMDNLGEYIDGWGDTSFLQVFAEGDLSNATFRLPQ